MIKKFCLGTFFKLFYAKIKLFKGKKMHKKADFKGYIFSFLIFVVTLFVILSISYKKS